jgi:GT2 family glycosyltransferase
VAPEQHPKRSLRLPVAVRAVDLESDRDLELVRDGEPYRSALIVGLRAGIPVGMISIAVDGAPRIGCERLHALFERDARPSTEPPPLLAALPEVSVVVTTCSNPGVVEAVASILSCDRSPHELIVVENRPAGSPVRRAIEARFGADDRVRYVEEARPGLGAARNAGLRIAAGEVVAFTDDDVEVDRRWVGAISRAFAAEPDAACVTGLILPSDLVSCGQLVFEQFAGFSKGLRRQVHRLSAPGSSSLFPFAAGEFGSGASTALRASVARSIGGFDAALGSGTPAHGAEDLDVYIRVLLAGYALVYDPGAILWHQHPDGAWEIRRRVFQYGVGLSAMLTKYALSGYAVPMLRRAPAGLRYLGDQGSRKNANKDRDYGDSLNWLERAGMLTGPVAYGRSLLRQRRAGFAPNARPTGEPRPALIGELDPTVPSPGIEPRRQPSGAPYERARLLARVRETPVGFVDVELTAGAATGALVDAEVARQLGRSATDAGLAPADTPTTEAPATAEAPATVVVCTRDRPESLRATLASILAMAGSDQLETLVVDNAPATTETRAVIDEFADARLRYVLEPLPGLSRARNRGVAEACGEIIAFTDDDVIVDPGWLNSLARGFARSDRVACVTGLIVPAELDTPAQGYFDAVVKWSAHFTPRLFAFGEHSDRDPLFPYRAGEFGAGANFAVTRAMARQLRGFDEALGVGSPAGGGEDLDFFVRVILAGAALAYEPSALVWHVHRSDLDKLRQQMLGYRTGLAAYVFKHLMSRRAHHVLVGVALAWRQRAGSADVGRTLTPPIPGVLQSELVGLASGPGAYLRGRRRARRRASIPLGEPVDGPVSVRSGSGSA